MYKDKEKQKEASKAAMKRYREKQGTTKGTTSQGTTRVQPRVLHPDIIANIKRISKDEAEVKVRTASAQAYARMFPNRPCTIIPTTYKMTDSERKNCKRELTPGQFNPVSKPGDPEYGDEMKPCSGCGKDIRAILTICLSCAEQGSEPQTASTVDERTAQ